jgi:hypothetical protein
MTVLQTVRNSPIPARIISCRNRKLTFVLTNTFYFFKKVRKVEIA